MKLAIGILVMMLILYMSFTMDHSKSNECKYTYEVSYDDGHQTSYANLRPSNGCIKTIYGDVCGSFSTSRTRKGTEYCKPKGTK